MPVHRGGVLCYFGFENEICEHMRGQNTRARVQLPQKFVRMARCCRFCFSRTFFLHEVSCLVKSDCFAYAKKRIASVGTWQNVQHGVRAHTFTTYVAGKGFVIIVSHLGWRSAKFFGCGTRCRCEGTCSEVPDVRCEHHNFGMRCPFAIDLFPNDIFRTAMNLHPSLPTMPCKCRRFDNHYAVHLKPSDTPCTARERLAVVRTLQRHADTFDMD